MLRAVIVSLSLLFPAAASAQAVLDCFGYQVSALAIPEPWEAYTRTYSNGDVRVTLMDTLEPAAGALYLLIQAPPRDEMGNRNCALIGFEPGGMGFAGLDWELLDASYDPSRGLTFTVPVTVYAPAAGTGFAAAMLDVTVNQATGEIRPELY